MVRSWVWFGLGLVLAAVPTTGGAPPFSLPVAWHIDTPCSFVGLFVEALPVLMALDGLGVRLSLHLASACNSTFLDTKLSPAQAAFIRRVQAPPSRNFRSVNERSVIKQSDDQGEQWGFVVADSEDVGTWKGAQEPEGPYVEVRHAQFCALRMHVWDAPPLKIIGRFMTETAIIPPDQAACLRDVQRVWVPTQWHLPIFAAAGVPRSDLVVVPEAVNPMFFATDPAAPDARPDGAPFVFLSVFRWVWRKGWDVLVRAYWESFSVEDSVVLQIHTSSPNSIFDTSGNESALDEVTAMLGALAAETRGKTLAELPPIQLSTAELSQAEMVELFRSAHAFVLPTRGEGWGLPIMEAMAMGLPAVASDYSGPTAFMTRDNSFPLDCSEGPDGYGVPSEDHLVSLMKALVQDPAAAAEKGRVAREDVRTKHKPEHIAATINAELWQAVMAGSM